MTVPDWTGLVAKFNYLCRLLDPKRALDVGKEAAFQKTTSGAQKV
jgi:hypothetical protein